MASTAGSGGSDSLSSKEDNSSMDWEIFSIFISSSTLSSIARPTSSSLLSELKPGGGGGGGIGGIPGGGGGVSDTVDAPSKVGLDVRWIGLTIARPQSFGLKQNTNG